jgi:hypothetical protein
MLKRTTYFNENETSTGESTFHHNNTTIESTADCEIRKEFAK